eukprot:366540-Chlamydomonas_euryale.AAC.7
MVHRRTLQWMGHILRMDEDRLPWQVFDCSLARSVAEDGRVEQLKLRPGHRNNKDFSGMYSSAIWGCHEDGSGGGTTLRDFLKLPGHTKLIPWPEIRAAAAERALDRQALRDAINNFAPCWSHARCLSASESAVQLPLPGLEHTFSMSG